MRKRFTRKGSEKTTTTRGIPRAKLIETKFYARQRIKALDPLRKQMLKLREDAIEELQGVAIFKLGPFDIDRLDSLPIPDEAKARIRQEYEEFRATMEAQHETKH